jgi:hypothetical protein
MLDDKMAQKMADAVEASSAKAQSAQSTLRVASDLDKALSSGKVIAGPFANRRTQLTQIGNLMGVAGDAGLEATRTTIQGLAKMALEGRAALKGQGAVSDYEGKTAAKAVSGDIEEMTIPEIKTVVAVAKRVSDLQMKQHDEVMKRANANDWQSFYSERGTPSDAAARPSAPVATHRFNPATGKVEQVR